jgi:hypothetical protein
LLFTHASLRPLSSYLQPSCSWDHISEPPLLVY